MKIVTTFVLTCGVYIVSCDTADPEIAKNTPNKIRENRLAPLSVISPKQVLHKTTAAYLAEPFLSGSVKFLKWYTGEHNAGDSRQFAEFTFVYNNGGDKALDLTSRGNVQFTQRISVKDNFALSDHSKRIVFDDVDAGMKAFQELVFHNEFLLGEIVFQDEGRLLLSEKMRYISGADESVNGTDCFVISLQPMPGSGLKRKVWITKDQFLISRYATESYTPKGSCIYTLEEYDYTASYN